MLPQIDRSRDDEREKHRNTAVGKSESSNRFEHYYYYCCMSNTKNAIKGSVYVSYLNGKLCVV